MFKCNFEVGVTDRDTVNTLIAVFIFYTAELEMHFHVTDRPICMLTWLHQQSLYLLYHEYEVTHLFHDWIVLH